ncbi:MAG: hypothetical protein LBE20_03530 [Deltaproteobacteria bacterium]|jgi:hypothetical protein|nr:hypothetical protein [Deltaproteobacteria bacterium]
MKIKFFYFGLIASLIFTGCNAIQESSSKAFDNANEVIRYYSGAKGRNTIAVNSSNNKAQSNYYSKKSDILNDNSIIWKATNRPDIKEEDIITNQNNLAAKLETKNSNDNSKYGTINAQVVEQELNKSQTTDEIFEGL